MAMVAPPVRQRLAIAAAPGHAAKWHEPQPGPYRVGREVGPALRPNTAALREHRRQPFDQESGYSPASRLKVDDEVC